MSSKWVNSPKHSKVVILLSILILTALVFHAGVTVGYHKAIFGDRMGKAYYRAFDRNFNPGENRGPNDLGEYGSIRKNMVDRIPAGFGAVGKIVSVNLPTIIVEGPDNIEKFVQVTDTTLIRKFKENRTTEDLTVDQYVIVLGEPNQEGAIVAKLIRLMPAPEDISKESR